MNIYGVIMAGGGGTRFWPLSRQKTPKQLLNLTGNGLMINEAIERLTYVTDRENIFIVTNCEQAGSMAEVTEGRVVPDHILSEPSARNTAACIGYAAMEIMKKHGDGVMAVTTSDHYIKDTAGFARTLNAAVRAAEETDKLITIGIAPTFPATGYGYIRFVEDGDSEGKEEFTAKSVIEFKEKPDEDTAREYVESGLYAWNSGMFVWKASVILGKFRELIPDIYNNLARIGEAMGTDAEKEVIEKIYPTIRKISIDYAIMEPSAANGNVLCVPGRFGWNDVGSWDMMDILHEPDKDGNVVVGDSIVINTTNSVVYSGSRMVAVAGVDNLVVVETPDALMVCRKDKAQDVKLIVDTLNEAGRKELL